MEACIYGSHRVIEPKGALPQNATKLDNGKNVFNNEILIEVDTLHITSASFQQIKENCNNNVVNIKNTIMEIVRERGKMENPVNGSGGVLSGKVIEIGNKFPYNNLIVGDKIVTLVSLTLTPLKIEEIYNVNIETGQVDVKGYAILFASGMYAKLPNDMDEKVAMAIFDVAGAPAKVNELAFKGASVAILGAAGKAGVLSCFAAKRKVGETGTVIGVVRQEVQRNFLLQSNFCDEVIVCDLRKPIELLEKMKTALKSPYVDLCINAANSSNTEIASILITKPTGIVYFYSMFTSFSKAALGGEGISSTANLLIGNGFVPNHAEFALSIVKESQIIYDYLLKKIDRNH